jgi:hypothetical protein
LLALGKTEKLDRTGHASEVNLPGPPDALVASLYAELRMIVRRTRGKLNCARAPALIALLWLTSAQANIEFVLTSISACPLLMHFAV